MNAKSREERLQTLGLELSVEFFARRLNDWNKGGASNDREDQSEHGSDAINVIAISFQS